MPTLEEVVYLAYQKQGASYQALFEFLSKPIELNKKGYFHYPDIYFGNDAERMMAL